MNIGVLKKHRFIAILRHVNHSDIKEVAQALYDGGVRIIEVTFDPSNQETVYNVTKSVHIIRELYGENIHIGAGTVLTMEFAEAAYRAGAEFMVSPCTDQKIIAYAKEHDMLSMPGAYTPTEIMNAYNMGADVVKIFPVLPENIDYLKTIISPLSHIPFVPTGGINPITIKDFLNTGAIAVAAGASLVNSNIIQNRDFKIITENVRKHLDRIREK